MVLPMLLPMVLLVVLFADADTPLRSHELLRLCCCKDNPDKAIDA